MQNEKKQISIIIPMYNAAPYLTNCLQSVLEQKVEFQYEVICVDNNSTDNSIEIAQQFPVKILQQKKQGSYCARNLGIKNSTSPIIAFIDSDCTANSQWLQIIIQSFQNSSTKALIGSRDYGITVVNRYEHAKFHYIFTSNDPSVYLGQTCNMAVRRDFFEKYGLFVEKNRGSDVLLANKIVHLYGTDSFVYRSDLLVNHLEARNLCGYYYKVFTYGSSSQIYQSLSNQRSLSQTERKIIFRNATRSISFFSKLYTGFVLAAGLLFWELGKFFYKKRL